MIYHKIRQLWTVTAIEIQKIWRANLIPMILGAYLCLLLIKNGTNWTMLTDSALMFIVALIGLVGFGALSSWVFAQEFTSQTFKDLLALPIPRKTIIFGKILAIEVCELIITLAEVVILLGFGWISFHSTISLTEFQLIFTVVTHTFIYNVLLSLLWPFVASITKSALLPTAISFGTVIIAVMFASQSKGQFIPWSIPSYYLAHPSFNSGISNILITLVALIGIYGTMIVWIKWDQK